MKRKQILLIDSESWVGATVQTLAEALQTQVEPAAKINSLFFSSAGGLLVKLEHDSYAPVSEGEEIPMKSLETA